jgi:sugar phosphate isomerase/epimerase
VREEAERDLPAVLRAIRRIGYEEVELYGSLYSRPAAELRRMLADHGLRAPSGHLDYEGLENKLGYARDLGLQYVICPMLPQTMWNAADQFKRAADQFNLWGAQARRMGLHFGFHNHNYEFRRFGNTTGLDVLLQRTDPGLVCFELDCYWVAQAGADPLNILKQHGKRIALLHVKDRKPGFAASQDLDDAAMHFTEVGTGSIDWKPILMAAQQSGVEHFFIEQDTMEKPLFESLEISFRNLRRRL